MGPAELARILEKVELHTGGDVIAGAGGFEDAAVVRVSPELALVATIDVITPVVDDPFIFGQIAAANALSDVYAMGGEPWFALNILCFPCSLPPEVAGRVIEGGASKVAESGAMVLGGHTVDDREPKYGLCVVGRVHPDRVVKNSTLSGGAFIHLTKPVGTGPIITALKGDMASEAAVSRAVEVMVELNRDAAQRMLELGALAATDVTGFGLLGHALEMVSSGEYDMVIYADRVPVLEEAYEYVAMGLIPEATYRNRSYAGGRVVFERDVGDLEMLLFDPQTSGGLLVALPEEASSRYNYPCIGYIKRGTGKVVVV